MAPMRDEDISRVMRELGRSGGRARAASQTPAERSALAKRAAIARWGCKNHWHCDPMRAIHDVCNGDLDINQPWPDRTKPCPACGVKGTE